MTTIRYDLAALDIQDQGLEMKPIDGKWHMTRNGVKYYDAPTKEALIEAYCNHDMQTQTISSVSVGTAMRRLCILNAQVV